MAEKSKKQVLSEAEAKLAELEAPMHAVHAAQQKLGFEREKRDRGFGGTDKDVAAAEASLAAAIKARKEADVDQQELDQAAQAVIDAREALAAEGGN